MQQVSKIYVRIQQGRNSFLRASVAPPNPFAIVQRKQEVVLKMLQDMFETIGVRKAIVHLVQEEKQERDPLKKVYGIRQWLDI